MNQNNIRFPPPKYIGRTRLSRAADAETNVAPAWLEGRVDLERVCEVVRKKRDKDRLRGKGDSARNN